MIAGYSASEHAQIIHCFLHTIGGKYSIILEGT
jgi:hypothetical protein